MHYWLIDGIWLAICKYELPLITWLWAIFGSMIINGELGTRGFVGLLAEIGGRRCGDELGSRRFVSTVVSGAFGFGLGFALDFDFDFFLLFET